MSGGVRRGGLRWFSLRSGRPRFIEKEARALSRPITITATQRDALYDQVLDRLGGISNLWMLIQAERFAEADRLGREVSDDLRLILDDLGWGDGDGDLVEMRTPPDVLRRALSRHCHHAFRREVSEMSERDEACRGMREAGDRNQEIVGACRRVLAELDLMEARSSAAGL